MKPDWYFQTAGKRFGRLGRYGLCVLLAGGLLAVPVWAETTTVVAETPTVLSVEMMALQERAKEGDMAAQIELAQRYLDGDGVAQDTEQAIFWLERSDRAGNPNALFEIGQIYRKGIGIEASGNKALTYLTRASRKKSSDADIVIAEMYLSGEEFLDQDPVRAYRYFQKAADQGDLRGLFYTGKMLMEGYGSTPQNIDVGTQRLEDATDKGYLEALEYLADAYQYGIPPHTSPNPEKASTYYRQLAEKGSIESIRQLATDARTGGLQGTPDMEKAVYWYEKGAEKDDPESLFWLGVLIGKGEGAPKSAQKSEAYLKKSAQLGYEPAEQLLKTGRLTVAGTGEIYQALPEDEEEMNSAVKGQITEADLEKSATELVQIGKKALDADPHRAVAYFTLAVDKENAEAQYLLAVCLLEGNGVSKDSKQAFSLLTKALEQEYIPACARLGECYIKGLGTAKNGPKGLSLLNAAKEDGEVTAIYTLATLYQTGAPPTIQKNMEKAIALYEEAGAMGDKKAYMTLAEMAYKGAGQKKDAEKAREYYAKAAQLKDPKAQYALALLYLKGEGGDADAEKGMAYLQEAANVKYTPAQMALGKIYQTGIEGVSQDRTKAAEWFEKAALDSGDSEAAFQAGITYMKNENMVKAAYFLERAAKKNYPGAANELGRAYQALGKGEQAVHWYEKAAWADDVHAQFNLAHMYETGVGAPQNPVKARYWYEQAAFLGDRPAQLIAAQMALKGMGGEADVDKALAFAKGALNAKEKEAYLILSDIYEADTDVRNLPLAWAWAELAAIVDMPKAKVWADEIQEEMTDKEKAQAKKELLVLQKKYEPDTLPKEESKSAAKPAAKPAAKSAPKPAAKK